MACWPTWPMPVWTASGPATAHGVRFVIRLKENWKPKVDYIARGQVTQEFFPGTDFDALLEEDTLVLDGRAIDADVHVGRGRHALPLRLVGVQTPKGYCFFLTNLPPRIVSIQGGNALKSPRAIGHFLSSDSVSASFSCLRTMGPTRAVQFLLALLPIPGILAVHFPSPFHLDEHCESLAHAPEGWRIGHDLRRDPRPGARAAPAREAPVLSRAQSAVCVGR